LRGIYARVQHWGFRLFGRHRHGRLTLEVIEGIPILVLPDVLNPKLFRTGAFLAKTVATLEPSRLGPSTRVLDLGTGSGIVGVVSARRGARVIAVDISPEAVRCARINALINRVEERIEVCEGDLFAPVGTDRFDLVLFNPPYLHGAPRTLLDRAFFSSDVVQRFAADLASHLTTGGHALVLLSSHADVPALLASFRAHGLGVELHAEADLVSERLMVYRLTPA
jgi:HemK-related putative methylase